MVNPVILPPGREKLSDRIGDSNNHDGNGPRLLLEGCNNGGHHSHDEVRGQSYKLLCKRMDAIRVAPSPAILDVQGASIEPAELLQTHLERPDVRLGKLIFGRADQDADLLHAHRLLRAHAERPDRCCAAEQRQHLASSKIIRPHMRLGAENRTSCYFKRDTRISAIFD
jgi:hypothetical protein